ncbi:FBP1-like protein [Mya arenaria]|uniref:FBP1-like protein n=1 Tax=Mya arenaria TaxID=6604 RepID=A0ABY7FT21_MYAAR|nr:FBP1-like protein [Mya arenaria]
MSTEWGRNGTTCTSQHTGTTCMSKHTGTGTTCTSQHTGTTCTSQHTGTTCMSKHTGTGTTCTSQHTGTGTACMSKHTGTTCMSKHTGTGTACMSKHTGTTCMSKHTGTTCTSQHTGTTCMNKHTGTGTTCTSQHTGTTCTSQHTGTTCMSKHTGTGTTCTSQHTGTTCTSQHTATTCMSKHTGTGTTCTSQHTGTTCMSKHTGTGTVCMSKHTGSSCMSKHTGTTCTSQHTGTTCTSQHTGTTCMSKHTGTGTTCMSKHTGTTCTSQHTGTTCMSKHTGTGTTCTSQHTGTTCTSQHTGTSTTCMSQYTGTTCMSQYTGSTCKSQYTGTTCKSQYTGTTCKSRYTGTTCMNQYTGTGSTCSSQYTGTTCKSQYTGTTCKSQYTGTTCKSRYTGTTCMNQYTGTTCMSQYTGTTCKSQYTGTTCKSRQLLELKQSNFLLINSLLTNVNSLLTYTDIVLLLGFISPGCDGVVHTKMMCLCCLGAEKPSLKRIPMNHCHCQNPNCDFSSADWEERYEAELTELLISWPLSDGRDMGGLINVAVLGEAIPVFGEWAVNPELSFTIVDSLLLASRVCKGEFFLRGIGRQRAPHHLQHVKGILKGELTFEFKKQPPVAEEQVICAMLLHLRNSMSLIGAFTGRYCCSSSVFMPESKQKKKADTSTGIQLTPENNTSTTSVHKRQLEPIPEVLTSTPNEMNDEEWQNPKRQRRSSEVRLIAPVNLENRFSCLKDEVQNGMDCDDILREESNAICIDVSPLRNSANMDTPLASKDHSLEEDSHRLSTSLSTSSCYDNETGRVSVGGPHRGSLIHGKFMPTHVLLGILEGSDGALPEVSTGGKAGLKREYWDDCGAWEKSSSPATYLLPADGKLINPTKRHGLFCIEKSGRKFEILEPQPAVAGFGMGKLPGRGYHGKVKTVANKQPYIRSKPALKERAR